MVLLVQNISITLSYSNIKTYNQHYSNIIINITIINHIFKTTNQKSLTCLLLFQLTTNDYDWQHSWLAGEMIQWLFLYAKWFGWRKTMKCSLVDQNYTIVYGYVWILYNQLNQIKLQFCHSTEKPPMEKDNAYFKMSKILFSCIMRGLDCK